MSRLRAGARVLAGVSLVISMTWLGANLYPYDAPQPLWTERDLPTLPAASDNGWAAATTGARIVELPERLESLAAPSEHDAERFWARVELDAQLLHEFMATSGAREANARVDAARRQGEFVDACTPGQPCSVFGWREVHEIAALRAIDLASTGDLASAAALLRDLIRMDVAHLDSARSQVSFLVALANLEDALDKADMIALRLERGEVSPDVSAALVEISRLVQAIDVDDISQEVVVVSEYLYLVDALDAFDGGAGTFDRIDLPTQPKWLFSRALTMRDLNERFERRRAAAVARDTFAALGGGERAATQHLGWWFRNPVGDLMVEALTPNPERLAASIDESLADLDQTRSLLLAHLS